MAEGKDALPKLKQESDSVECQEATKSKTETTGSMKLHWKEADQAPRETDSSYGAAVVSGTTVYFYHTSDEIRAYDTTSNNWTSLPSPPHMEYSLAVVNNKLTAIGGGYFLHYTNKLYSLAGQGIDLSWIEDFKPMPTRRASTTALTTGTALIVAGGKKTGSIFGDASTQVVEVMNTDTHQWSVASHFPTCLYDASATVCDDSIYVVGMRQPAAPSEKSGALLPTKEVYTCSVNDLLQSCSRPLVAFIASALFLSGKSVWKRVADLPVTEAACVTFHGRLLTIGGRDSEGDATTTVHMYDPATNSWEAISHMSTPRIKCFAAVLPDDRVMVVGGHTNESVIEILGHKVGSKTCSVETASIE